MAYPIFSSLPISTANARKNQPISQTSLGVRDGLRHSFDLSSVRGNLTGNASSKDFNFLVNIRPWLPLLLPLLPSLNLGMLSGAVPAILQSLKERPGLSNTPAMTQ